MPHEVLSPPFSTSKGVPPKVFGCICFVHVHGPARGKIDLRALKCVFVGYSPTQKGYKCYRPHRENNFSIDVAFFEIKPYFSTTPPLPVESLSEEESFNPSLVPHFYA